MVKAPQPAIGIYLRSLMVRVGIHSPTCVKLLGMVKMTNSRADLPFKKNLKLLAVNSLESEYDPDGIQDTIETCSDITRWLNHFPGLWLVETEMTPYELSSLFYKKFDGISCFAVEIDPKTFSGRLSGAAWIWLLDIDENEILKRFVQLKKNEKDDPPASLEER